MADRILLTKTDLANVEQIAQVTERIAALNPTAPLRHVIAGNVDATDVFDLGPDAAASDARMAQWLRPLETDPHHGHHHRPFRHADDISSIVLRYDQPIAWPRLQLWLESVLSLRGDGILRLKGLVQLEGENRPIVLQGVHHVLHPPVYLERLTQPAGATQIVLITRGLSAAGLRASFAAAMALTRERYPRQPSFSRKCCTLPSAFRGNSATKLMSRGNLKRANCPSRNARTSSADATALARGTTNAAGTSCHRGSGTPITAASATDRMLQQHAFDLRRIDVLAARHDHVLLAIMNGEVSVGIAPRDITCPEPALAQRLRRRRRIAPVFDEHVRSAHQHLTGDTVRHILSGIIDHTRFAQQAGQPGRARPRHVAAEPCIYRDRARLGRAINLQHRHAARAYARPPATAAPMWTLW